MIDNDFIQKAIYFTNACGKNAAKEMSLVTGFQIDLVRSSVSISNINDLSKNLCGNDSVVICNAFQIEGAFQGIMLFLVYENKETGNPRINIVRETGAQVINSYLQEITADNEIKVTHLNIIHDMLPAIIESSIANLVFDNDVVYVVECEYDGPNGDRYYSMLYPNQLLFEKYVNGR